MVYVIPDKSIEDERELEAEKNNTVYDPLQDKDLNLEQITKLINDQNAKVKAFFKKYAESSDKEESLKALNEQKKYLVKLVEKEK